jgi:uncharacterized protein with HEPN domain
VKSDEAYLRHIADAAVRILQYTSVGHDRYLTEPHWQDAVIRQLEIIGEATKWLSPDLRAQRPEIPWGRIAGLRDVLIHNYMGVDLEAVWAVTQHDVPQLRLAIEAMLRARESEST